MNAISRLFEVLRFSTPQDRPRRRRRARFHNRLIACETLEPKQLLAVDLANPFADQSLDTSDPYTVAITNQFDLTDVLGTVAKFETNAPIGGTPGLTTNDFYVEFYDKAGAAGTLTPGTVANFLSYVNDGSYDNTMIHRSVSDFVVQGGGFTAPSVAADQPGSDPVAIATKGAITNEPGNSNLRGTLAMAKLGGQPNSATSQWFVNQSDNTFLDTDNGGYAVFGEVLGDGMTVVDVMGTALNYDATTYYSNGAFSDLPLWNVNADNIVLPQDFVKIETITALTDESELMTYSVTTSDTSKLAASINAAGDLVLTPVAGQTGSVSVTVTATSKTDGSTASDTFAVGLGGGEPADPTPVLTAIESAGNTVLNKDQDGKLYAGDQPILYDGSLITFSQFPGFTPVAVEDFADSVGKQLLLQHSSGDYLTWSLSSDWAYTSGTWTREDSSIATLLTNFGLTPPLTVIEGDGNSSLNQDVNGKLYAGDQPIIYGGSQITFSQFPGFTPVAVEDFADSAGKQLLLQHSSGDYLTWSLSSNWAYTSGTWTREDSSIATLLTNFGLTPPRPSLAAVESAGDTLLNRDDSGRLYAGDQPIVFGGSQITLTQFTGYTPLAVEDFGDSEGKKLLFEHSSGRYFTWTLSASWGYSSAAWTSAGDSAAVNSLLTSFGLTPPAPTLTAIESGGAAALNQDDSGKLYANDQPILFGGSQITVTQFTGYTPLAVDDFDSSGGKQLLFKHSSGRYFTWTLSTSWAYSAGAWTSADDSAAVDSLFTAFGLTPPAPSYTAIESRGASILQRDSSGKLFVGGQPILFGGNQITATQFAGYTPRAAEDRGASGGNQLIFEHSSGDYFVWTMTANWAYSSGDWARSSDTTTTNTLLEAFGLPTALESAGTAPLRKDADGKLLAGDQPILYQGVPVSDTQFAGFTPLAVDDFDAEGGKQMLFQYTNGNYFVWSLTVSWAYSAGTWTNAGDSSAVSSLLTKFGLSAPTPTLTAIESLGTSTLNKDSSGKLYAADQPITYAGSQLTETRFAGFTPLAIEDFADARGKQLLLKYSNGDFFVWSLTATWGYSSGSWVRASDSTGVQDLASDFGVAIGN